MGSQGRKSKKLIITALLFAIGVGVFVFALGGTPVQADCSALDIGACLRSAIGSALEMTINALTRGIGFLMFRMVGLLVLVGQYNDFINAPAVAKGWVLARDVMNMFFVIVLLVIAIATILQKKELAYQAMLPRLIITALVINFSKTICGLLIDASQIFMLTFFGAIANASGANFAVLAGIPTLFSKGASGACGVDAVAGAVKDVFTSLFAFLWALVMIVIATIVITALLIMLIVRIVTLWFLVILSPVAFFFIGLKQIDTQGIGKNWTTEFMKQIFFGPAVGFFLWLSLAVTQDEAYKDSGTDIRKSSMVGVLGSDFKNKVKTIPLQTGIDNECSDDTTASMGMGGIMSTLVGMGLLIGTLVVAGQTSNKAGSAVSGFAMGVIKGDKMKFTPWGAGKDWVKQRMSEGEERGKKGVQSLYDRGMAKVPFLGRRAEQRVQKYAEGVQTERKGIASDAMGYKRMSKDKLEQELAKAKLGSTKAAILEAMREKKILDPSNPAHQRGIEDVRDYHKKNHNFKGLKEFDENLMKEAPQLAIRDVFADMRLNPTPPGPNATEQQKKEYEEQLERQKAAMEKFNEAVNNGTLALEKLAEMQPGESFQDVINRLRNSLATADTPAEKAVYLNALAQLGDLGNQPNDKTDARDARNYALDNKMNSFVDKFDKNLNNNREVSFFAKYGAELDNQGNMTQANSEMFLARVIKGEENLNALNADEIDALVSHAQANNIKIGNMLVERLNPKKLEKELADMQPELRKKFVDEMESDFVKTQSIDKRRVIARTTGRYDMAFDSTTQVGRDELAAEMKVPPNRAKFEEKSGKDTYARGDLMAQFYFEKGKFSDDKMTKIRENADDKNAFVRGTIDAMRQARVNAAFALTDPNLRTPAERQAAQKKWQEAETLARTELLRMSQSLDIQYTDANGAQQTELVFDMRNANHVDAFKKNLGKKFKVEDLARTDWNKVRQELGAAIGTGTNEMFEVFSKLTNAQLGSLNVAGENGDELIQQTIDYMRRQGTLTPEKITEMKKVQNLTNRTY